MRVLVHFLAILVVLQSTSAAWINDLSATLAAGLSEATPIGSLIGNLSYDNLTAGESLTYSTTSEYFNVDPISGVVTLKKQLVYRLTKNITVVFVARVSGRLEDPKTITFRVLPINHPPAFDSFTAYRATIKNTASVGSDIVNDIKVADTDEGPNGTVTVQCDASNSSTALPPACDYVSVLTNPGQNGLYSVTVRLAKQLNATVQTYNIPLRATDSGNPALSATALLVVTVESPQDTTPKFLDSPIVIQVKEFEPLSSIVARVRVQDGRPIAVGNTLKFDIVDDARQWFRVNSFTQNADGIYSVAISPSKSISLNDNNKVQRYTFGLMATQLFNGQVSQVNSQTSLVVNVMDINDHAPTFQQGSYSVNASEGLTNGATVAGLSIVVTDDDLGDNSYFELGLEYTPSPAGGIFGLLPVSGTGQVAVAVIVNRPEFVRFANNLPKSYELTLTAKETKTPEQRSSTARVTIHVVSAVNHPPYFPNMLNPISVPESTSVGAVISNNLKAADQDFGSDGILTYSITDEDNSRNYFSIDAQSAELTLRSPLIASVRSKFSFSIVATDGAGLKATMAIFIGVVASLGPQFDQPLYTANCTELKTDLYPPITIKAFWGQLISDRVINCKLADSVSPAVAAIFSVNPSTGSFTMLKGVDYMDTPNKQGSFYVEVQCFAVNSPNVPSSSVFVRINVTDTNNHAPYFVPKDQVLQKTIKDNTPSGSPLLQLEAADDDVGINAQVEYFVAGGGQDNFVVNRFSGILSLSPTPLQKADAKYNVTVIAVDSGQPPLTGTTTVYVTVVGTVSRAPAFQFTEYVFYVNEGSLVGLLVGSAPATSPDFRALIAYRFMTDTWKAYDPANVETSVPVVQDWFSVDNKTAEIRVKGAIVYSTASKVTVRLEAKVTNQDPDVTEALLATVPVTIYILRQGDANLVRFIPSVDLIYLQVVEQVSVDYVLYRLYAFYYERSTPVTNFTFINGSEYLKLDQTSGALSVAKKIEYATLDQTKNITVVVRASAPPPSDAQAKVTVVVNVTPLQVFGFNNQTYSFQVYSNAPIGNLIGNLTMLAGQDGYTFRLQSDTFQILNNGSLVLKSRLDATDPASTDYTMVVVATSKSNNRDYQSIIQVKVIPVRTFRPVFLGGPYAFVASLGSGAPFGRVQAFDPDPFNRTAIKYAIVSPSPAGPFSIDPATGFMTMDPTNPTAGDFTLNVSATDTSSNPLVSYSSVTVHVTSASGGAPAFPVDMNTVYGVYINEKNQLIPKLSGTSPDGRNLSYYVDTSKVPSLGGKFVMDKDTGELTFVNLAVVNLNGAEFKNYSLFLVISDGRVNVTKEISLGVYSRAPPTFICKSNPMVLSARDYSMDPLRPSVAIEVNSDCSRDKPGTPFYYKLEDGNLTNVNSFFKIDLNSGEIVPLATMNAYFLNSKTFKVKVSNSSDFAKTSELTAIIRLTGRNARAPTFNSSNPDCPGTGTFIQTGVLDLTALNTPVVRVQAGDCDVPGSRSIVYNFKSTYFNYYAGFGGGGPDPPKGYLDAFGIDPYSGQVYTNVDDLRPFYGGFFRYVVQAASDANATLSGQSQLVLYILREYQMFRVVFNKEADAARNEANNLVRAINASFAQNNSGIEMVPSPITTYVDSNGVRNKSLSSMCYFLLQKSGSDDYRILDSVPTVNRSLAGIWDTCFSKVETTKWWSGYWFLWYILIAFSILVFFVALALTLCVCLYWPINLQEINKARPYVVFTDNPPSMAGSVVNERW